MGSFTEIGPAGRLKVTATSLPDGFTENPILMFMLSSDKDQRKKNSLSHWLSISANESQNPYFSVVNKRRLQKQNKRDDRKREMLLLIGDVKWFWDSWVISRRSAHCLDLAHVDIFFIWFLWCKICTHCMYISPKRFWRAHYAPFEMYIDQFSVLNQFNFF